MSVTRKVSIEKTDECPIWSPFDQLWIESDAQLRERLKPQPPVFEEKVFYELMLAYRLAVLQDKDVILAYHAVKDYVCKFMGSASPL